MYPGCGRMPVPSSSPSLHPVGKVSEFDAGVIQVVADRNGGGVVRRRAPSPVFSNPWRGTGGAEGYGILREEALSSETNDADDDDDDESAGDAAEGVDVVSGVNLLRSLRKLLLMKDGFVLSTLARASAVGVSAVSLTAAVVFVLSHPLPFSISGWYSPPRPSRIPFRDNVDGCMGNDPQREETRVNSCGGDVLA